jgi:dTDP-glucose 4,6-dehydratase/UDP-glucuronate decarboxylase
MTPEQVVTEDLEYIRGQLAEELPSLSGKRVLITGGAGFQWLSDLASNPNLRLVKHDITDPLPDDFGPYEFIIHAASIASPIFYRQHPIETMDANVNGLRSLLDWSLQQQNSDTPVEGFLYFSTSEIYGDPSPEYIPTDENYRGNVSCTGPRACYDESKRYGETLCVSFAGVHNVPVRIARPFNNYGPGLKITDGRALPDFARNVLGDSDIVLYSDGSPTRTFCYVADAVVGYFKILVRGRNGESYNIGTDDDEISMRGLAELVVESAGDLFDYEGAVIFENSADAEYLTDNPNRRCPVIDKARNELDYDPGVGLRDGVRRSLIWYSGNQEAEAA